MTLAFLSITRCVRGRNLPHVPTPEDRIRQFRAAQPVQFANTRFNFREVLNGYPHKA